MPETNGKTPKVVTAAVLVIGNEILSGRTKDANLHYLATGLTAIGIRLMEARVVPDIEARIIEAVNALRTAYDYVFTTGGIGPTHDDITSETVAKAFGVKLIKHPKAVALLTQHYGEVNLTPARLRQVAVPFQPLLGGLSPEEGWKSLQLLKQTMPELKAAIAALD